MVGAQIGDLQRQVTGLQDSTSPTSIVTIPEIDGTFAPTFRRETTKHGGFVFVTLAFLIPAPTQVLRVSMVKTADRDTNNHFQNRKFHREIKDIDDTERAAGRVVREIDVRLDFETPYDVFRLAADGITNPPDSSGDVVFGDPPLLQFTTPIAFGVPSSPAANLHTGALDPTTKAFDTIETFRMWAPLTDAGAAQTWGAAGATDAPIVIEDFGGGNGQHFPHKLLDAELTQVDASSTPVVGRGYVDIVIKQMFTPGAHLQWTTNICWVNGIKKVSTGPAVGFFAGNCQVDPTLLTSRSLAADATDPYDGKTAHFSGAFTQPTPPVALKNAKLFRSTDGGATYTKKISEITLKADELHTVGPKAIDFPDTIKTKKVQNNFFRMVIEAIGGLTVNVDLTHAAPDGSDVPTDTALPTLGTPTLGFTARVGVTIDFMTVSANWNQGISKDVELFNGGAVYLDTPTYLATDGGTVQVAASEVASRHVVGPGKNRIILEIRLADLKTILGTNLYLKYSATNAFGRQGTPVVVGPYDLTAAKDILGTRNAVRVVDIAATLVSPGQMLGNGDMILVDAGTDEAFNWARWDGVTTPLPAIGGTGYRTIKSSSAEIAYVSASDSIWMKANTSWQLIQNIKRRLKPGNSYALGILLRAGASITPTVKIHYYNLSRPVLTGTANVTSSTAVVGTGTLFLSELAVSNLLVISGQRRTVTNVADDTHATVSAAYSAASGAMNVIIDNINDTIAEPVALTTSYQILQAGLKMKDSPQLASTPGGTDYANHQFGFELISNTQDVFADYFMHIRGEQALMYAARGDENDNSNIGTVPTFISVPDIVSISGVQGGGFEPDNGGLVRVY